MQIAFVIGSPHRYAALGRTGACLIHEAHRRGGLPWVVPPETIDRDGHRLVGWAHAADFPRTEDLGTFWRRLQARVLSRRPVPVDLGELDALVWRKDPPLDRRAAGRLASLKGRLPCLNDPAALLSWSSKVRALERLGHLMPPSRVATTRVELRRALRDLPGPVIIKPLEDGGGRGVVRLSTEDRPRLDALLGAEPPLGLGLDSGGGVLVQREVRGRVPGDVRLLSLEGRILGAMRRVPRRGEFRANVAAGARVAPAELSRAAVERWEDVARTLSGEGLYLVGLDVIDGWLIEVNAVSPAGIPRLNALLGRRLEREVLDWLEGRLAARR